MPDVKAIGRRYRAVLDELEPQTDDPGSLNALDDDAEFLREHRAAANADLLG